MASRRWDDRYRHEIHKFVGELLYLVVFSWELKRFRFFSKLAFLQPFENRPLLDQHGAFPLT